MHLLLLGASKEVSAAWKALAGAIAMPIEELMNKPLVNIQMHVEPLLQGVNSSNCGRSKQH